MRCWRTQRAQSRAVVEDQRVRDRIAEIIAACPTISNAEALEQARAEMRVVARPREA